MFIIHDGNKSMYADNIDGCTELKETNTPVFTTVSDIQIGTPWLPVVGVPICMSNSAGSEESLALYVLHPHDNGVHGETQKQMTDQAT